MPGKFVDNNAQNLIIVFQSAGRVPGEAIKAYLERKISDQQIAGYHSKYNWFNLSKKEQRADYYYIEDHYSGIYGWYISDFGKSIVNKIQNEIQGIATAKKYKNVVTFGSSKGGSGALVHGILSPYVNRIFALVPQIDVTKFIDIHFPLLKPLIFPNKDDEVNQNNMHNILNFIDFSKVNRRKTIFLYTSIFDEQFQELNSLMKAESNKLISITRMINVERKNHSSAVFDNLSFIYQVLTNVTVKKRTVNKSLFKIQPRLFVYLGGQDTKEEKK